VFNKKIIFSGLLFGIIFICPIPANPLRSFEDIFPGLQPSHYLKAFCEDGHRYSFKTGETQSVIPDPNSGIDLLSIVMEKTPSDLIEALLVIPYYEEPISLNATYNALGRISDIKNHPYFQRSRNKHIFVFEESSRIESEKNLNHIPDPPPSLTIPASEDVYIYLKDKYFGSLYGRGSLSTNKLGMFLQVTNFKTVYFFFFPIMKAEKFCAVLYAEPLEEGMLLYGMAAVYIPEFLSSRINIPIAVERRLNILIDWFKAGLGNSN